MASHKKNHSKKTQSTQKRGKRIFLRVMLVLMCLALAGVLCVAGVLFFVIDRTEWQEFDPSKIENLQQTMFIYDNEENTIAGLHSSVNRINVSLDQIPQSVKDALISTEDTRFYEHGGVDVKRILGALLADLKAGGYVQGASTLTQQLVKLTHLTNEKTMARKLQEAYLAIQMERTYSKDQILEMYLNVVYYGNGAYGIEAAAQSYFGKTAMELTTAESAMMIACLKSPTKYAPHINLENNIERRNLILGLMKDNGKLTEEAYQAALAEQPHLNLTDNSKYDYGYFVDAALNEAMGILDVNYEDLTSGGYHIYTSLDTEAQKKAEELAANGDLYPDNAADGTPVETAIVLLNAKDGTVAAAVGGREYTTRRGFNRVTQARRQPGSTIKPVLVYAQAFEKLDYSPASWLLDEETDFNGYKPNNAGQRFYGWVNLRFSLKKSLNIPAVKIFQEVGVETGKAYAQSVGIPFAEADNNLALALGGFTDGVTPLELAGSYLPFANEGKYNAPSFIRRIEDSTGKVIYENPHSDTQALSSGSAFLINNCLESTVQDGTATRLQAAGVPLSAKTGSVSYLGKGLSDAWVIGFNADYIGVCWMGYDKTDSNHFLPSDVSGGKQPAIILAQLYQTLYPDGNGPTFTAPSDVTLVNLDLQAYNEDHELMLATENTPSNYVYSEYFLTRNAPSNASDYWKLPETPQSFDAWLNADGKPAMSVSTLQRRYTYQVVREDASGNKSVIREITDTDGYLELVDEGAPAGANTYYVLPKHGATTGTATNSVTVVVPGAAATPTPDPGDLPAPTPAPTGSEPTPTPAPSDEPMEPAA